MKYMEVLVGKNNMICDKVELIEYEEKYADIINEIEDNQWGSWSNIREQIGEFSNVKLAKLKDRIIGLGYGRIVGDAFHIQAIVIIPEYQHKYIGSIFMEYYINYAKEKDVANIICECIIANGKINAENMMNKYGFKEILINKLMFEIYNMYKLKC